VSINARYGFKEVSARRLQFIRTYYKNRIIKTYELSYKTGYFNKRMLCFVLESSNPAFTNLTSQMRDAICEKEDPQVVLPPGVRFHRFIHFKNGLDTNFDYDEVPISDANVNIAQPSDVKGLKQFVGNSQLIDLPFSDDDRKDNSNLLGTNQSFSIGGQGSVYLGLGPNPITKNTSLSGSYSYSHNSNRTFVSFMDIDGDGYPDRLYREGNAIFYQRLSYVNGQPQFAPGQLLAGLQSLGSQTSNTNGWGIQGVVGIGPVSGNRSFNYATTKGTTKRYFADVDGDGLSDFVDDGEVKFNKLNSYGEIEFIQPEGDTIYIGGSCGYIVHSGAINDSISIGLPNNDDLDWERRMMSHQPVRMWKAPYKGSITINAPIQLVEDTSESRKQATSPDGVSYTIQHNSNQLYKGHISANDYTVKNFTQTSLSVDVGDQIYFRLLPKFTRTWDNVLWLPSIEYTSYSNGTISGSNINSDSLEAFKFEADNEFWVYEKRQTKMPFTANVRLHGTITSPPISDTLRFFILNNAGSLIHESFFLGSNGISFQMDQTISVNEDDTLYFGASSNSRIGYERVKFDLMLDYLSIPNYPGYDVNSEVDRVRIRPLVQFAPYNREVKPSLGHVSSNSMSHSITPVMTFGSAVSGKVILSVKKNNAVVTEQTYEISSGQVVAPIPLTYTASTGSKYFYEFHSRDFSLSQAIESSRVLRQMGSAIDTLSAGFYGVWHDSLSKFGPLYRGWGYFVYNVDTINPIDESRLIMLPYFADTNRIKIINPQTFANDTANILNQTPSQSNTSLDLVLDNLLDAGFYTMIAYPEESCYRGIGNLTTIKRTTVSNWFEVENAIERHYENPIPVLGGGRSPKAIRKTTKQRSWTNGASIGISSLANASGSRATTEDRTMVEYMDLNGDRFPDIVGEKYTQFSMPTGGLFPNVVSMAIIHNNKEYGNGEQASTSRSGNLGGTAMRFEKEKGTKGRTLSNGGGASTGSNQSVYSYMDVNGDGLPDKVNNAGEVALNIGYGFEGFVNWGFSGISSSSFASGNLGLDFQVEKGQNSWALGAGLTGGFSTTEATPVDINGDGLIDFMNQSIVWTNTGNGFIARPFSSTPPTIPRSENFSVSANVSGTFGTTFLVAKAGGSVSVNLGYSKSYERGQFIDMNNDGFVDFVSTNNSGDIVVHFSKIAKFNMLKRVESSIGNAMTISYKNIPSSTIMPQAKWVMDSLWVFDGLLNDGTDYSLTTFDYQGGRYDRYERIFMGYDSVITRSHRDNGVTYRTVVEKYHTNDFLFKGLQFEKAIRDSLDRIYVKNETVYGKYEIIGGAKVNEDSAACFGPYYPAIYKEVSSFFEGGTQSIVTRKQYMYGPLGTVVSYKNHGDTLVATDDLRALISYRNDSSSYIIGLPLGISVFNAQNSLVRHRLATYDIIGQLTNMQVNLGNGSASSDFEYDQYGNVSKMTLPPNAQNQRMFYEYTYDDTVRSYPVRIEDAYGYVSSSKYDFWRGNIIESTDMAGNKVKYTYNANGRLRTIQGPKEIASGQPFTLRFAYWDDYDYKFLWRPLFDDSTRLWAKTEHYDEFNAGNTISTVLFTDGLGRVVQTKKKSVVNGNEVMVVSGRMKFDEFGRTTEQFYPTTEPLGNDSLFNTYWPTSVQPSRVFYDVLDRPTREIQPDASQTFHVYGFGTDQNGARRFRKTTTDAEGTSVSVLTDPRELQMRIIAPLGAVTDFKYNALGELIESKDPEGFVTTYSYDIAGRRVSRMHPDAGQTNWSYDPAGNLISMANANLLSNGQTVNYSYHFGQLLAVTYPTNPENDVYYAYGNSGNSTGRIAAMQDASGAHTFEYGAMGELILKQSTGYVPVNGGDYYTFSTQWQYDSWNRVKSINYPDGELVSYNYDRGGQFISMEGTKANTQNYVSNVEYDEFGSRTFFAYGNGTSSTYTYDANSRRLLNLVSTTGNGDMLDLTYTYDDVGNITRINNTASGVNGLGANYRYNYVYDSLYRLIDSDGNTGSGAGFELLMSYSPSGNIISKTLTATKEILGNTQVVNYANDYTYNNAHMVSMVNDINGIVPPLDFQFDGAGNMTLQSVPDPNMGRHERLLCWDEENRLSATRDQYYATANIYDASGNRAWKLGGEVNWMWNNGQGWQAYGDLNLRTWYQSDLVTITDQAMTKHYFISGQRIASKLVESLLPEVAQNLKGRPVEGLTRPTEASEWGSKMVSRIKRDFDCVGLDYNAFYPGETRIEVLEVLQTAPETNEYQVFFYHSDHLGSSSFITDINGDATQHLQYLPFGEDFVHQQNTAAYYTPYTFSGKERDVETSLSYFGARYYEAGLSIWLSVDPLSDKYPSLSAYNYCALNPVMLVDPDGRELDVAENQSSTNDLLSIVSPANRDRVKIENGKVSVNTEGLSQKDLNRDKGLSLINDLVTSEKKYLFESTEVSILKGEDGQSIGLHNNSLRSGIINASNNGKDSKGQHEHRPPNNYDGYVSISSSGKYTSINGSNVRTSVVYHELMENFLRTDKGIDYSIKSGSGAHLLSQISEGSTFSNPSPGQARFTPPARNRGTLQMMHFIILERTKP
jgi:RHS repeat-associated protein